MRCWREKRNATILDLTPFSPQSPMTTTYREVIQVKDYHLSGESEAAYAGHFAIEIVPPST